jgi:hypothetical protein
MLAAMIRVARWPPGSGRGTAFEGDRRLRILLDPLSLDLSDRRVQRLVGFSHHDLIEAYSTSPLDGVTEVVMIPGEGGGIGLRAGRARGIIENPGQWDRIADELDVPARCVGRDELRRQLLVLQVAASLGCDALVTASELLRRELPEAFIARSGAMSPDEGLAVIGLFLRSQGRRSCVIDKTATWEDSVPRGLFYWLLARPLLPLDVALLMLNGALDATARVVHRVYGFGRASVGKAGWRKDDWWLKRLAERDSMLADSVKGQTSRRDVMDIVGLLRNTIHGEALEGISSHDEMGVRDVESLVRLPRRDEQKLLAARERCGGQAEWGVRDVGGGFFALETHAFIETLIPKALAAINGLMEETDYGRLPGADRSDRSGPPQDDHLFNHWTTDNILSLAGLSAPWLNLRSPPSSRERSTAEAVAEDVRGRRRGSSR